MRKMRLSLLILSVLVILAVFPSMVGATHSWGGYHWARTANPFTLKLGDNLSSTWDPYLVTTSSDWSQSSVLDTVIVAGGAGRPRTCKATSGRVEVCNATYGNTGWLGVASISVNGTHITSGTVKLNDTYFNTAQYNTPAWRNLVTCQEVGHTFGLDHQDENFTNPNLNTCMDYTNSPASNQHPNQHDYDELVTIYSHLDSTTTVSSAIPPAMAAGTFNTPADWGKAIRGNGQTTLFVRDFGGGSRVYTFVFWAR